MPTLRNRMNDVARCWLDGPTKSVHVHKPLLQCKSNPDSPPPYWECAPNMRILRYGPRASHQDTFYCRGGVNAARLLHLSRKSLFAMAYNVGGNVLLDERWHYTIAKSRVRYRENFRVRISYSAIVAEASQADPQKVARIEDAKGIDGVMTVLARR